MWNGEIGLSIPFSAAGPKTPNCVSGLVDSVTGSLAYQTVGLADEVVVGGRMLCDNCPVKPPVYREFVRKLRKRGKRGRCGMLATTPRVR